METIARLADEDFDGGIVEDAAIVVEQAVMARAVNSRAINFFMCMLR